MYIEETLVYYIGFIVMLGCVIAVFLHTKKRKNQISQQQIIQEDLFSSNKNQDPSYSKIQAKKTKNKVNQLNSNNINLQQQTNQHETSKTQKQIHTQYFIFQQLIDQKYWKYVQCPQKYIMQQTSMIKDDENLVDRKFGNKLQNILMEINAGYLNISYHNLTHAFDVTTCMNEILLRGLMDKLLIKSDEYVLCLIAAFAHDIGHEGLSDPYYRNSKHQWCVSYGGDSSLEKMHIRTLFGIFSNYPEIHLEQAQRQLMVSMILATDNTFHHKNVEKLAKFVEQYKIMGQSESKQMLFTGNKLLILGSSLHFADLNNCSKQLKTFVSWSSRLFKEFQIQAQRERLLSLPITYTTNISNTEKSCAQFSFIKGMVLPLYVQLETIFQPSFSPFFAELTKNFEHYKSEKNKVRRLSA